MRPIINTNFPYPYPIYQIEQPKYNKHVGRPSASSIKSGSVSTVTLTEAGWSNREIGTWDSTQRIATLITDVPPTIHLEFQISNFTLEGQGHYINGDWNAWICAFCLSGLSNIIFHNLKLNNTYYAIRFENCGAITLDQCTFTVNNTQLTGGVQNLVVKNCEFSKMQNYSIYLTGGTLSATDNLFRDSQFDYGAGIDVTGMESAVISGNHFSNVGYGVSVNYTAAGEVSYNAFANITHSPIRIYQSPNVIVKNNSVVYDL